MHSFIPVLPNIIFNSSKYTASNCTVE